LKDFICRRWHFPDIRDVHYDVRGCAIF
jgi:hypothetical protein